MELLPPSLKVIITYSTPNTTTVTFAVTFWRNPFHMKNVTLGWPRPVNCGRTVTCKKTGNFKSGSVCERRSWGVSNNQKHTKNLQNSKCQRKRGKLETPIWLFCLLYMSKSQERECAGHPNQMQYGRCNAISAEYPISGKVRKELKRWGLFVCGQPQFKFAPYMTELVGHPLSIFCCIKDELL